MCAIEWPGTKVGNRWKLSLELPRQLMLLDKYVFLTNATRRDLSGRSLAAVKPTAANDEA